MNLEVQHSEKIREKNGFTKKMEDHKQNQLGVVYGDQGVWYFHGTKKVSILGEGSNKRKAKCKTSIDINN